MKKISNSIYKNYTLIFYQNISFIRHITFLDIIYKILIFKCNLNVIIYN